VPVKNLMKNPDVTVRGRGVMEKCTYCVQRINHARIEAKKRGDKIKDGEVTTACMDACPSRAIVFGNKSDETSRISKMLHDKRSYKLLDHHLNTRPRTVYLSRVTNPNQEIEA
jgi:molybdopterin-containing oxidoreductase family iron-sulfur binding subunit